MNYDGNHAKCLLVWFGLFVCLFFVVVAAFFFFFFFFSFVCVCVCAFGLAHSSKEREPVWLSGKVGMQKDHGSIPLRLSFLVKSYGLWAPSCVFAPNS